MIAMQCTSVGHTGRNFDIRIEEHAKSIKNTSLAQHCVRNCRFPDLNHFRILHCIQLKANEWTS